MKGLLKRSFLVVLAVTVTVFIGFVDVWTGPKIGLSLFYLLPVLAMARWVGRIPMLISAASSSAMWWAADYATQGADAPLISVWNGVTRLGIYILVGWLTTKLRGERDQLKRANRQLVATAEKEALLARTDALTGLANSRAFLEAVEREVTLTERHPHPWAVAYIDIDNFKKVNDTQGHAAGDDLLLKLADGLRETLRASDIAGRLGGDEFAVLLPHASRQDAEQVMQRYVEYVNRIAQDYPGCQLGASIGVVALEQTPASVQKVVQAADAAMYEIKVQRKRRIAASAALAPA